MNPTKFRKGAYSVEIGNAGGSKALGNLRRGHNSADGMSVSHWLRNGYNVWNYTLLLKGPVMGSAAPEPDLHLVRNHDSARIPHRP